MRKADNEVQFGRKSRAVGAAVYQQLGYEVRGDSKQRFRFRWLRWVEMTNNPEKWDLAHERAPLTLIMSTAAVVWWWRSSERLLKRLTEF